MFVIVSMHVKLALCCLLWTAAPVWSCLAGVAVGSAKDSGEVD